MILSTIQVGTILIDDSPLIKQVFDLKTEACSGMWSIIKLQDGAALDHTIDAAGWNFFFMAAEVKVMFFGALGAKRIHKALTRLLEKVKEQYFNALEITGIDVKHFLGLPYTVVSAHSRHIQPSRRLDSVNARRMVRRATEWARG
jgi:hypothetical protein